MFTQRIKYCRKIFLIGHLALYGLMLEQPSLQASSGRDSLSISSENILIPRTISESGMCKVIETPKGPIEQSALVKGIELRTRIEHPQTQEWPYRVHGHMIMKFPHNIYVGTGILVLLQV